MLKLIKYIFFLLAHDDNQTTQHDNGFLNSLVSNNHHRVRIYINKCFTIVYFEFSAVVKLDQ